MRLATREEARNLVCPMLSGSDKQINCLAEQCMLWETASTVYVVTWSDTIKAIYDHDPTLLGDWKKNNPDATVTEQQRGRCSLDARRRSHTPVSISTQDY